MKNLIETIPSEQDPVRTINEQLLPALVELYYLCCPGEGDVYVNTSFVGNKIFSDLNAILIDNLSYTKLNTASIIDQLHKFYRTHNILNRTTGDDILRIINTVRESLWIFKLSNTVSDSNIDYVKQSQYTNGYDQICPRESNLIYQIDPYKVNKTALALLGTKYTELHPDDHEPNPYLCLLSHANTLVSGFVHILDRLNIFGNDELSKTVMLSGRPTVLLTKETANNYAPRALDPAVLDLFKLIVLTAMNSFDICPDFKMSYIPGPTAGLSCIEITFDPRHRLWAKYCPGSAKIHVVPSLQMNLATILSTYQWHKECAGE